MAGFSLFFNQINMCQIFLHVFGCIGTVWMILAEWSYIQFWRLWGPFG